MVCSILLGVYFIGFGIYMDIVGTLTPELENTIIISKDCSMMIYAGIEAFAFVQIFNWAPRKWRGSPISFVKAAGGMGYAVSFAFDGWWPYFPLEPFEKPGFTQEYAFRHYVIGGMVLIIAIVDYFTFYNYPMQRSIILARTERSLSENQKLVEIAMHS